MAVSQQEGGADAEAAGTMTRPRSTTESLHQQQFLPAPTIQPFPNEAISTTHSTQEECTHHELNIRHLPTIDVMDKQRLSFFQRYFTKPISADNGKEKQIHDERQFSWLSTGSLALIVLILLILAGIIAAAVAISVDQRSGSHHNTPVRIAIPSNFPDPALLYENGTWYAFGTNNAAGVLPFPESTQSSDAELNTPDWGRANIQMATSKDFISWTTVPLADQPLANTGEWTQRQVDGRWIQPNISSTWAPAVIRNDEGNYVMYYASARGVSNPYTPANGFALSHPAPHCIGVAVSDGNSPAGPYTPLNEEWICPWQDGGAIDPEVIRDIDGTLYLVYKVDGNNIGSGGECGNTQSPILTTPIMLQKLGGNGTQLIGPAHEILTNNSPGDGPLVEAPMLVRSDEGIYFLVFSSGCTQVPSYDTKYATATNITGPYTRQSSVLLKTGYYDLEAPGSIGIVEDGVGGWNLAFHARVDYGDVGRVRAMFTTKLQFRGHEMKIVGDEDAVHLKSR